MGTTTTRILGALLIGLTAWSCADEGDGNAGTDPPAVPPGTAGAAGNAALPPGAGAPAPAAGSGASSMGVAGQGAMPLAGAPALPVAGSGVAGAGVAGATGAAGAGSVMDCTPAPMGSSPAAITALMVVNTLRVAAGAGCATMISEINTAAQNHCDYYAANSGMCTASAHNEVMGCTGFTGEGPGDRMQAAGYQGRGGSEVMAFSNDPEDAVRMWVNSVWHRIPILDPWTTELGYGGAEGCDTIDFGRGTPAPEDTVVVYPYAGQVGVETSFDGSHEGPEPPAPSTGWPSAAPVTLYAQDLTVTEHVLTRDGDTTPIEHVWLTGEDSNFLRSSVMMYANAPYEPQTTYRVRIAGTYVGGALTREWTFTTGDPPRFGRP